MDNILEERYVSAETCWFDTLGDGVANKAVCLHYKHHPKSCAGKCKDYCPPDEHMLKLRQKALEKLKWEEVWRGDPNV